MRYPKVLPAFTKPEYSRAHTFLASKIARMMGRKLEEGDWADVYCAAKGIPNAGWSNLNIDVIHRNLGVEHKMLRVKSSKPIKTYCGTRLMHPAATRSIRIPAVDGDPTEVAQEILTQYADLIEQRRQQILKSAPGMEPDLRIGWLLWQESLREFLYFEKEMLPPDPQEYWAEWRESGGGARKASRNLWVYETDTGAKRFSITTSAGAKIQPYFDVPTPKHPNLYYFCVQGEDVGNGLIRIWITPTTVLLLTSLLGSAEPESISAAIIEHAKQAQPPVPRRPDSAPEVEKAQPILITKEAYTALTEAFSGVSDEHMLQQFVRYLSQ